MSPLSQHRVSIRVNVFDFYQSRPVNRCSRFIQTMQHSMNAEEGFCHSQKTRVCSCHSTKNSRGFHSPREWPAVLHRLACQMHSARRHPPRSPSDCKQSDQATDMHCCVIPNPYSRRLVHLLEAEGLGVGLSDAGNVSRINTSCEKVQE